MSNTLLTIGMITRRALMVLENNLSFTKQVNRQYDDRFAVSGAKIGTSLDIRIPPRYTVTTSVGLSAQDATETKTTLTLSNQHHVDLSFTSQDLTLSIDDFSDRFIQPAIAALANKIDATGLAEYVNIYNAVGTPGTTPASSSGSPDTAANALFTFAKAMAKLDHEATPRDNMRAIVIDPTCQSFLVPALSGLFHSSTEVEQQYKTGNMGLALGAKFSMDQNVYSHTVGPLGGTPLMNGSTTSGATTLVTDGWTASAASRLKAGDVFTIANVYAVNPQSRVSTGQLRQFVVTADVSSDSSGNATIPVSPAVISSGAFQTVNSLPADNAAITVLGAASTVTPQNLAFHRDAFTLACVDLEMPGGVDWAARVSSKKLGISMRMVRQYDINNDAFPCRVDVLYGWKTVRPSLACRIAG
jgi:hypothetical protein